MTKCFCMSCRSEQSSSDSDHCHAPIYDYMLQGFRHCSRPVYKPSVVPICRQHEGMLLNEWRSEKPGLFRSFEPPEKSDMDIRQFIIDRSNEKKKIDEDNEVNGWVYYLKRYDGRIKIGKTLNLEDRLNTHRRTYGALEFICAEPGYTKRERERHLQFADLRCEKTEWFNPGNELLDLLQQLGGIRV